MSGHFYKIPASAMLYQKSCLLAKKLSDLFQKLMYERGFFSTDFRQVDQVDLPKPWVFCLSFWVSNPNLDFFPLSFENFSEDLVNFASKFDFFTYNLYLSPCIRHFSLIASHFWTYLPCFLHWFLCNLPKPWVLCLSFEFFPWVLSFFILEFFWRGRKKAWLLRGCAQFFMNMEF